MWAMRITHECSLYDSGNGNCFVTLTYRPKSECSRDQLEKKLHIPDDWSLSVPEKDSTGKQIKGSHFQNFIKRVRKAHPNQKIKYYQAGEYGNRCKHGLDLETVGCPLCNLGRPHHHACLFNINFNHDLEPYAVKNDITRYTSKTLERLWGYGFVDIGKLEFKSAAYVARYIMKKVTGDNAKDHYQNIDPDGTIQPIAPEYSSMSNGIGAGWYEKYKSDCFPSDDMPVPGSGVFKKVPRYYEEKLKNEDPQMHEEVKEKRIAFRDKNAHEYTSERLMAKYKVKHAQSKMLKREL